MISLPMRPIPATATWSFSDIVKDGRKKIVRQMRLQIWENNSDGMVIYIPIDASLLHSYYCPSSDMFQTLFSSIIPVVCIDYCIR